MTSSFRLAAMFFLCALALPSATRADAAGEMPKLIETTTLRHTHVGVNLPPINERVPQEPLVVNLEAKGRVPGRHGGDIDTLIGRAKDARLVNAWGYARLVGYDEKLQLKPDILKAVDNEDDRVFTLHLRKGHKWSDGAPFTAEDFRYWWEDVANNDKLSPAGPPRFMLVNGKRPRFEVIDETTVRYAWDEPNALFLPELAKARPPFIYRPAHYLKQFHEKYGNPEVIAEMVAAKKVRYWASLHNERDDMFGATNWAEPSLQPWVVAEGSSKQRQIFIRNPYYHRIDENGRQLPYVDRIVLTVADGRLISAKTQAGESSLQARGLAFSDITVLKRGEEAGDYTTCLWPIAKGSHITLYPNFTTRDPVWRALMRDTRFRHALSLGIDRRMINRVLYFGLALESNDTILPQSPLYEERYRTAWAMFDPKKANALLDEIGLTKRRGDGIRLLPDGRPLEIIVETTGESAEEIDALGLVGETWREIGVKLFPKPSQREVLRERALSGGLVMSAWGGLDNGIPTADMPPNELAPTNSEQLSWAQWGDYMESGGKTGEPIDYEPAQELSDLYRSWLVSATVKKRREIWHRMLELNAEETLRIGLISAVKQPVVVSNRLRNVPTEGIYGWDPGAQFGIHRMDEFWLDRPAQQTAEGN